MNKEEFKAAFRYVRKVRKDIAALPVILGNNSALTIVDDIEPTEYQFNTFDRAARLAASKAAKPGPDAEFWARLAGSLRKAAKLS